MFRKLTRFAVVGAALSASVVGLTALSVSAAPPLGANTLTPASGTDATVFSLTPPAGASCTGSGSGTPAYRWQTYMVSAAVDASTLTYASGPNAVAGQFVSPLFDSFGTPIQNRGPAATPLGLISGIPTMSLSALTTDPLLVDGAYKIGFACTQAGALDAGKYWETPITISGRTATGFNYSFGAVPGAPTGVVVTAGDAQLSVAFAAVTAAPSVTGYTVTATPSGGGAPVTQTGAGSPIVVAGLTNGTLYNVTVAATNSVGTGATAAGSGTPVIGTLPGVTGLTVAAGATQDIAVLNWTNPAGSNGATIAVTPAQAGFPVALGAGVSTYTTASLAPGLYQFTVTATYAAGNPSTPATYLHSVIAGGVLIQDITVVRPTGALVLTQRCGVNGSAAALPSDGVFGPLAAIPATLNADPGPTGYAYGGLPVGTAPTPVGATEFAQYPYPVDAAGIPLVTYPTNCGVNLGTGRLITSGVRAGQYFAATGVMNQITVVNTQDVDSGWTLNGRMSAFNRTGGGDSFSGNLLGWNPEVTYDSAPNLDGYDMSVAAGGVREATSTASTSGLGDVSNETNTTLAQSLAKSPAGSSLGMAVVDARLRLLIPVTANSGTYTGTLTFTTV